MTPREKAIELLASAVSVEASQINDETTLTSVAQWDSLAHMRLIVSLEKHLGRRLRAEDIISISSLKDIVDVLSSDAH